jgi:hypothetical protein
VGGVQAENATTCSSYIPTTVGTVPRNADVLSTPTAAWYNAAAGTVVTTAFTGRNSGSNGGAYSLNDGTSNERIEDQPTPGSVSSLVVSDGGALQVNLAIGNVLVNTSTKTATAHAVNDFAGTVNAGAVAADGVGTLPTATTLNIGHLRGATQYQGGIRTLAYYPQRLPNAMLQSLTA